MTKEAQKITIHYFRTRHTHRLLIDIHLFVMKFFKGGSEQICPVLQYFFSKNGNCTHLSERVSHGTQGFIYISSIPPYLKIWPPHHHAPQTATKIPPHRHNTLLHASKHPPPRPSPQTKDYIRKDGKAKRNIAFSLTSASQFDWWQ